MHDPQRNLDDDWAELDKPATQSGSSTMLYAGIGIAVLFGLVVCGVATYLIVAQFRERTTVSQPPVIVLPTSVVTETAVSPTEPPDIAPTSTLPATATSPPLGSGSVEAITMAAPPTIDGNLAEWNGVASVTSPHRVFNVAGWNGSEDLTAVWQLAWDSGNLYVAITVTDDTHVQTATGNQLYRGDGVDIQFDTVRDADYGNALSPDDFQITLSPGDFGSNPPAAYRYQGTAGGGIVDAVGGHSVTVAARPTDSGYTLEAAIPWTDLNTTPSQNLTIGLALNANDNDTPGTAVQEVMMSNMPNRTLTNPTTWGTLTLR